MIDLLEIDELELKRYVEVAYKGDDDLLTQYHVDKYTLEEAVNSTMDMIKTTSLDSKMFYYGVVEKDEKIGYICVFSNNLYSFGVNIEMRTKEILSEFWELIKAVLGNNFMTVLYPNNTRAIEWVKKCGMVQQECVILLYNN